AGGFWCQGPAFLQMLQILDGVDLAALGHNTPDYVHTVTEAMKLAFADREAYYGDPRHVAVPAPGLLDPAYGAARRSLIDPARAWPAMPPPGTPAGAPTRHASHAAPAPAPGLQRAGRAVPGEPPPGPPSGAAAPPRVPRRAGRGREPRFARHLVRLCGRPPRERVLGHAERRVDRHAGHSRHGAGRVV